LGIHPAPKEGPGNAVDILGDRVHLNLSTRMRSLARLTLIPDLVNAIRYARTLKQVGLWMAMPAAELERFQRARLRETVAYAYAHVELYRRKWQQAGVGPGDIKTLADLQKLPVITRGDLRHSGPEGILSREFEPHQCWQVGTSGSTGSPVSLFVDIQKALLDFAVNLPQHMAGRRSVTVASGIRDLLLRRGIRHMAIVVDEPRAYESLYGRVFWQMRHTIVDSLLSPQEHIAAINRKRPTFLMTYPSVLRNICLAVESNGSPLHQPALILVVGEVLDESLRSRVKRVFGAELMDVYGSTEVGFIAAACPARAGLHLLAWKVLVELLDEEGREVSPGQTGRVVVTDLFNRATPIIRYAGLGDYAAREDRPCPCGRSLPLLARVDGRIVDSVVLPCGRLVHPYHLTLALEDIPHVSKFQIRQDRHDHIRVLLVKDTVAEAVGTSFSHDSRVGQIIRERFGRILGDEVAVDLDTVLDIPRRPGSHKFATVLSTISGD